MTERTEPEAGDLVAWKNPVLGTMGHTGRIVDVRGRIFSVEPTAGPARGPTGNLLVERENVEGWWPKGSRNRSWQAMRRIER